MLEPLAPIAGRHHERLDGSGYNRGAIGTQLRVEARRRCGRTRQPRRSKRPRLAETLTPTLDARDRRQPHRSSTSAQLFGLENVQDIGALDLETMLGVDRATQIQPSVRHHKSAVVTPVGLGTRRNELPQFRNKSSTLYVGRLPRGSSEVVIFGPS